MISNAKTRAIAIQFVLLALILAAIALLVATTLGNLRARGMPIGFDFLTTSSRLVISESLLSYDANQPYYRAILVGIGNTLFISLLVIVFSTILGLIVGLARLSSNPLVAKDPNEHDIIKVGHTAEPNGVAIARGDDRLHDIVRWTVNALVWAEAHGITSANVDEKTRNGTAEEKRVLGATGFGKNLGLDDKWAFNVIKQNGNYAEIWDRNLGKDSPLKVSRGLNALWKNGGLNYPYPWD